MQVMSGTFYDLKLKEMEVIYLDYYNYYDQDFTFLRNVEFGEVIGCE